MGNNNCKQCTTSVFENEEDEETWFEWIESRKEASSNQNIISPKARPWPVQPLAFQADTINRQKKSRSKPALNLFTEGTALKGLHLANSEDDRPSLQSVADNNNSPWKNRLRGEEESIYSQLFPDFPAGEVNISLKYEKSSNRLKVCIVKARNLCCKAPDEKKQDRCGVSCSDLYLILSLMSGQKILQSFRTSKKKGNSDILFYENYSFDLTSLHLFELSLRLTAMHCCKHVINTDHVIGYVDTDDNLNETSFGSHWLEVITCSGRKINRWHTLWC